MITASLKTNLILKELGITRFSSRSSPNKSIFNSIYIYKIDKVSVFLKKDFKEYDIDQKKLILAIMNSTTLTNGESSGQSILFDNKNELDDIIDSAGTICNAADKIIDLGANSITSYVTHGVLTGKALEKISASKLTELVITDSINNQEKLKACEKIRSISISDLLGEAIKRISEASSVSSLFEF